MANYNINVKATVNVSQVSSSIKEALAKTIIRVAPKFDVFANDNHVAQFRNQVANILEKQPVPITLAEPTDSNIAQILGKINSKFIVTPTIKFDSKKDSDFQNKLKNIKDAIDEFSKSSTAIVSFFVDTNNYNELKKVLENIKNEKQNVSKIDIKFAYNEQEVKKLEDLFHDLNGGIEQLDKGAIEISFAPISDEYLIPIKTKIDQYFKDNPITLTIAETTGGIDLKSLIESFQEYQKTIKAITVDGLENQRASLRIQANDLKEYYNRGITSAQEYRDKLKALLEDQQNDAILSAKGSAKTKEDLARELSRIEVQIANQTKAEQERIQQETADSWKKSIDDAFESLQSGGSFKKFQKELEALKENGLQLNISGAQEYYDKVLKDGTEYIANLKEQNKQIGTMKGEITRLFNLVSEGKADISKWDDSIEKWKSKDIFQTEQVQEHFTKLSSTIDALYETMLEKQKKAQEEEEKEIELLQEQVHLRSEIRSSMFEDVDSGINTQQQALDEKKQEFENYLNSLETIQKHTAETTKVLEKAFNEDIQNIFRNYQRHTTDFEAFNDDFWKRVRQASEQGISEETIQKAEDKWNKIADAHQKSVDKINQQQEKANQKAEQERQKEEQRIVKYLEDTRNKILKEEEEKLRQQEQAWNKETQDLQEKYNKQLISTEEYIEKMEILVRQGFDNGYDKANHYSNSLEQVKKKQEEAGQSADDLGNKVNNLGSRFDNVFNSLMRYFGVTKIFDAIQSSFSKMIQEVRDLDVELTEFSKVTDLTSQQTEKFIDNAYALGDTVARTGTEVITATTLFKKMGYDLSESMDFAKDALMWTNVADGMVSVEEAANMLISTMKAYGEESISTTQIIDALNEVSNKYATSSSALSNNLSTVAATLASSGTDLYQTIGLMTAGIEVMPDKASKVANGLKTISQRIRQIDGDTADKLDEFLGSKGLSRYDELTGQLKGTYDILYDISGLWQNLTINEKQYIGEVMAGKNQITVLNALMTNFATAINATGTAMDSAGSAAEENKRVLESIQGHINGFRSAFSKLSKDLISSDLFKNVVDVGTFLIKVIDVIASNPLTKSGFFLLISMLGSNSILNNIEKIGNKIGDILSMIEGFPSSLDPISLGITAIIAALGVAYNIIHKSNEEVEQARQNIIDAQKKEEESIDSKIKKYEELQKKYNLENLTREEQIEILRQINELNEGDYLVHGDINEEIRLQNEKLYIQKSLLAGINEEASKSAISFDSGFLGIKDATRSLLDLNESISSVVFDKSGKIKYTDLINSEDISLNIKKDTLQGILDALDEIPVESRGLDWLNIYDTVSGDLKAIQGEVDNVNKYAKDAVTNMLQSTGRNIKTMTDEELGDLKKQIDGIKEKSDIIFTISTDPDQIEQLGKMIDSEITARAEAGATNVSDAMDEVAVSLSGAIAMLGDYASQAEILAQAQDDITNSGQITAETLKKIADAGLEAYLVYDEETKSLVVNTQAFFDNNAAQEDAAIAAYVAGEQAKLEADIQNILSGNLDTTTTSLGTQDTALEQNATAHKDAATAAAEYGAELEKNLILEGKYTDAQIAAVKARVDSYKQEVQAGIAAIHSFYQGVTNPRTATPRGASHSGGSRNPSNSGYSPSPRSTTSPEEREAEEEAKNAQKAWKDAFEVEYKKLKAYLDDELITYEEYYDALEILNEQFFAGRAEFEEEYWKYKDEAIKGYKKYIEDELKDYFKKGETALERSLEKEEITQEQYFDYLEELYKAYYTDKDEYEEAMAQLSHERFMYEKKKREQEIQDLQDQISDLFNHGETLLEHQLAMDEITEEQYYEALTLLYETYYDDKEKYEEEYWKLQEKIYAYQKKKQQEELNDLENQLEELYNEAERLHKEYVESLEEENDALETTISYAIDVLDEEIDKLKAEKSALDEANEALSEQIKLQELEDNLEKAKQKKVRVYRKGQGFIYEQDTKAISEAQTALDEYKKELQHKKQLSMIDEEINKLEEYKKEWKSITESYKNAQDEITAKGILGENARKRILTREQDAVELVGKKYENVKDRIKTANDATIDNMEAYIGDENTANTLSYEIKKIKDKIDEVKGKTVKVGVESSSDIETIIKKIKDKMDEVKNKTASISVTDDASSTITNIISKIGTLKRKLEQSYSTQNMTNWLTKWKDTIDQAYSYSKEHGITPGGDGDGDDDGDGDGDSGHPGDSGGRTDGYRVGDWVTIPDSDIEYAPFRGKRFKIVQFENQDQTPNPTGDYVALLVEGGREGEVTYRVPVSHLNGGSDTTTETDPGSGPAGKTVVSREPIEGLIEPGKWGVVGYEITYSDGTKVYEEVHARGTLGTTSKTFMVNEDGMEAMVTPEGTVISAPSTGYGVIKNEYTERLTDFAADPMSFLSRMFTGYSGTYQNNNNAKNEVININGNLTLPNVTDGQSFINSIKTLALQYTTRR